MRIAEIGKKDTESYLMIHNAGEEGISSQKIPTVTDERLLATHGRTFHFAARFLPPKQRRPVVTLYAFFRTLDDIVDQPHKDHSSEEIRLELLAWKSWFTRGYTFPAPREPLGSKLAAVLAEHPIPTAIFLDFLDGHRSYPGYQFASSTRSCKKSWHWHATNQYSA
jgi:Squalene/phytoene synthase